MNRLSGKVAIITGGAQGMGESHARMFVAQGAKVVITDINKERGEALAAELGDSAIFLSQDVASEEDWQFVVSRAEAHFGLVNALVNNAGVLGPGAALTDFKKKDFENVCAINQTGVFLGMQAVIPAMIKAGGGAIINISSIAGIVAIYGSPNIAYNASKFAVRGLTKQAAVEYGRHNIRVNSVHPGFVKTPMMAAALSDDGREASKLVPLNRLAEPADISNLVVFLASDESAYITGAEHVIDGGVTAV
ncbi:MAG: glucose 1-dehydrogenase [Porticoccaceae bacterium]|nr:glucose 1-dehydrogenase [Porticoccaceae bacterium]